MKVLLAATVIIGVLMSGCFRHVGHYTAKDGSTIYVGEFHNDSAEGYGPAEVKGYLYDESGNLIDTAGGFLCLGVDPKGTVPFKAWTFTAADKVARVEWTVVDPPSPAYLATGLEAKITNTFVSEGTTYVVGEVTNKSSNIYIATVVCASWTDSDGTVVREAWNNGGAWRFNPGDKIPFSLPVDTPPAGSEIHLYLDSIVSIPGEIPATAVDIPQTALQHSRQSTTPSADTYVTTGMGEVHNDSGHAFRPDAVASVYDSAGRLLATRGDPSDCFVNAAPGGFTYMTYTVIAGVPTAPQVSLQGYQYNNGPVYFPALKDIRYSIDLATHELTVTGTLTNTSSATLNFVGVCAGAYDASGAVRAVTELDPDLPEGGLPPGASMPFTITMPNPGGVARVGAVADAAP